MYSTKKLPGYHELEIRVNTDDFAHQEVLLDGKPLEGASKVVLTVDASAMPCAEITYRIGKVAVFGSAYKIQATAQSAGEHLRKLGND